MEENLAAQIPVQITDEIIPIFLASDENYAPFLATAMFSILKNTKSFIEFYILDGGIKPKSKNKIEKSLNKFQNKKITYCDMKTYNLEKFPNLKHYSLNTFSRYFIPELAPNLKKVLYLDVDIIVSGDISTLFNQDIENYPLGAISEDFHGQNGRYLKDKIYPEYKDVNGYFNAGVLILDIQKFIENNYSKILIEKTIELSDKLSCPDQDVFNIIFEENYKKLDYKFNFMPDYAYLYDSKLNLLLNKVIIHYTGRKPWKTIKVATKNEFLKAAVNTAFCPDILFSLIKNMLFERLLILKSFLYRNIKKPILDILFNKQKRN